MVLSTMLRWASEYNECRERHNALVDVVQIPKDQNNGTK